MVICSQEALVTTGKIESSETTGECHTQIKVPEYLIWLIFFASFPVFYRHDNEGRKKSKPEDSALMANCFLPSLG